MKTIKILTIFVAAVLILNSCNKETAAPTVSWDGNLSKTLDFTLTTADTLNITVNFAAEAGITKIDVWKHIYHGSEVESTLLEAPTGYTDLLTFTYAFEKIVGPADFVGGITQIAYEFEVTDSELRTESETFTYLAVEAYTVTFEVEDDLGNVMNDAIVTLDGTTNAAGDYVFNYIEPGTFAYSVEKTGYTSVSANDLAVTKDTTISIVLAQNIAADWSANIILALQGQTAWATYNGTAVTIFSSDAIGFAFTSTTATTVTVTKTANCTGWVLVDDITGLTTQASLVAAYNAGTELATYDLPYDQHAKAYATRYFVSKIGDNYILVKYVEGYRDAATGNIVVFQYKD